jgi:penicillin-insensitive murein endopeptidase
MRRAFRNRTVALILGLAIAAAGTGPARPQSGQPAPEAAAAAPSPEDTGPIDRRPAKRLFGAQTSPAPLAARAIGFYSRGCLAGAAQLAQDGEAWQAMRLSRNRTWGHPDLIRLVERLAADSRAKDGWPGLLVGDLAQPRGGPMLTGHASHQIGLDADIWLTPMPSKRMTIAEREALAATSMLGPDKLSVNPEVWSAKHVELIKRAASYREVERILVHPAIKKALCAAAGQDRGWLSKVRPYWGHHYHFHVRMGCPKDSPSCRPQPATGPDDGCGKELDEWFARLTAPPKPAKPQVPRPPLTLAQLPPECRDVLGLEPARASERLAASEPRKKSVKAATAKSTSARRAAETVKRAPGKTASPPPTALGAAPAGQATDPIGAMIQSLPWPQPAN